jgi:hypothetical protein
MKKLTRAELAEALAKALNLLNDVDRDEWTDRQLGAFHELANVAPECCDYANNGTVQGKDFGK